MAAIAANLSTVKIPGTSTAFTAEACTLTTGTTYQINTAARRVLDPSVAVVVKDAGVAVPCTAVDYLFGTVTLSSAPGGAVTVDASYLPMLAVAEVFDFSIKSSATVIDNTVFTDTTKKHTTGLKDLSGSINTRTQKYTDQDSGAGTKKPIEFLEGSYHGGTVLLEIQPAATGNYFRGWAILESLEDKGAIDGLLELAWSFQGCSREGTVGSTSLRAGVSYGWGT